ncbi:MAG: alpha/beta hydrolase [Oscillospiraceae bacterium]|nr:alpha/beta hydrolase [Oscillospiraceae bacterium]
MILYILLLILLAVVFGGGYYAYRVAFFSPANDREKIPQTSGHQYDPYRAEMARIYHQLNGRSCEFVTITSHDGLILSGRYYHVKDGAPLDIGFHGYRSSPLTDFSGGSELSFQLGHNLLLIDQRAHGKSQGRTITFGILERQDVLRWVEYAVHRFGPETKITLYGVSMGASTVLMASELDLPKNVKAIVADCPYSSPMEIILHVARRMPIPNFLVRPFVTLGAWIYGGFDIHETDAARAVKNARVPILIIHGEADGFVPCEMSDIVSANPTLVTRHTFPGADHGISYLADTPRYHQVVTEFLETVL